MMRILYGVQGTGNGHISRAHVMAQELSRANIEVDFLFSGRAKDKYFAMQPFGDYATRQGFTFVTSNGRIQWLQTLRQLNLRQLNADINALDLRHYDLVLNDYEPITAHAAKRQKVPCVGISHQNAFRYAVPKLPYRGVNFAVMNRLAPVDVAIGLHWHNFGAPILPPIIDHQHTAATTVVKNQVLVYLPFENCAGLSHLLNPLDDYRFIVYHPNATAQTVANCQFKPPSREGFAADLAASQSVFCNAGFELPSEALAQGKRLLVKPVSGQIEQGSNALALEALDLAWSCQRLDRNLIREWLETAVGQRCNYPNVAAAIVAWLDDGRREPLQSLSERLWAMSSSDPVPTSYSTQFSAMLMPMTDAF